MEIVFKIREVSIYDPLQELSQLRRPKLLVKAAQHAKLSYRRQKHLTRIFFDAQVQTHLGMRIVAHLTDLESELNDKRKARDASYSITRHIDVLAALLAEADRAMAAEREAAEAAPAFRQKRRA